MAKKSGNAGSPVLPTVPEKVEDADIADPGKMAEIKAEQLKTKSGKYGSQKTKPPEKDKETKKDKETEKKISKIKLVAICEVLNRNLLNKFDKTWGDNKWGYVEGAADNSGDNKILPKGAKRKKEEGQFRQYLDLKKDIEIHADKIKEADKKIHPEFGRMIAFKAKVEWEDKGEKESIAGKKIYWGYERTYKTGEKTKADRQPVDKEGFVGLTGPDTPDNGSANTVKWFGPASVDKEGWSASIVFRTSSVEGDLFKLFARADVDDSGKPGGTKKETQVYTVSRLIVNIDEICEVLPKETLKAFYKKKGKEDKTPDWGCIEGAADKSEDKNMPCEAKREKTGDEEIFRQYINLKNDLDLDNIHPEYGRQIQFKAKLKWENETYKDLPFTDKNIYWGYEYTYEDRPETTNPIKATYKNKSNTTQNIELNVPKILNDTEKEKFDALTGPLYFDKETADDNDKKKLKQWFGPVKIDKDGWTKEDVKFTFSKYAGDVFKFYAKADIDDSEKPGGEKKQTQSYQVWRKFWYQQSHYSGFTSLPDLADTEKAYKKVKAVMLKSDLLEKKSYTKPDLTTKGVKDITIYQEQQFKFNNDPAEVTVIGTGNEKKIREFLNQGITDDDKIKEPVKSHIMYCDYQCDYAKAPGKISSRFYSNTISYKDLNPKVGGLVLNPPVEAGKNIFEDDVRWALYKLEKPSFFSWTFFKNLFKSNQEIAESSEITTQVPGTFGDKDTITYNQLSLTIDTSGCAQYFDSSGKLKSAYMTLYMKGSINYANEYLGDCDGHHVIIVANPNKDAQTCAIVSHEIGHSFSQTPRPASKPESLPNHPMQHIDYGSHCFYKAKAFDKNGSNSYKNGTCAMAQNSSNSTADYCPICEPYIKLQDMATMNNPRR